MEKFLPAPKNTPSFDLGIELVDGEPAQVVGQGDSRFFIATRRPAVVQLDIFSTATALRERIRFSEFEDTAASVDFPRRVSSTRFDATGACTKEIVLTVSELQMNPTLSDSLFAIEGS